MAHGVTAVADTIFVAGGSAKANANFGPGLYEMEACRVSQEEDSKPEWKIAGSYNSYSQGSSLSLVELHRCFALIGSYSQDRTLTLSGEPCYVDSFQIYILLPSD